jgi:hypothetical protein
VITLRLRPMTEDEFAAYRAKAVPEYAADKAATGRWTAEEAEEQAAKEYDQLLPDGVHTPGMPMFVAEDDNGGRGGRAVARPQLPARRLGVDLRHRGRR